MRKGIITLWTLIVFALAAHAQSSDDMLNILVQKKVISQTEADSMRAETAIAAQANLSKVKAFPVNASKKINIAGYNQVRYQVQEEKGKPDGFDIRRARLDVKGVISPYWGYRVQFDLAGSPKVLDAYMELKLNDYINFTAGQFKVPFSYENLISSTQLALIDRSQAVEALTARGKDVMGNQNGRDIGLQLSGLLFKSNDRPVLDYRLGIFNGAGINTADNNEKKDLAARLSVHPVTGLDVSASAYRGTRFIPEVRTNNVVTTPSANVDRNRYGADLSYDWKNLSLRSEYIRGMDNETDREGYYIQGGYYLFQRKFQLVAKYDFYDADLSKADDASTWEVIGANFFFNPNTKIQANYTFKQEEGTAVSNNLAAIQLQIGF